MGFNAGTILDLPFRLHGRDPATGVDCFWVLMEYHRQEGRTVTDPLDLGRTPESCQDVLCAAPDEWVAVAPPYRPGDALVLLGAAGGSLPHVAVYLGNRLAIHATEEAGVVVVPTRTLAGGLEGGYRLRCLDL